MISMPLFKRSMKAVIKILILFITILAMYSIIIIWMFDPDLAQMLDQYQQVMPGMMSAVGMVGDTSSLIGFINTYLYGFIMLIIPMIFEVMIVNSLVMKYIDNGSLACILATPNSRKKIITTQIIAIILSVFLLIAVTTIIGYVSAEIMFKGELNVAKYINLNISTFLLHIVVSGIAFLAACLFNEEKSYLALGAGLPIAFYLIQMLSNMGDSLEKLKYLTLYTLLPSSNIVAGDGGVLEANLILIVMAIALYTVGFIRFIKKDLPL
ncbi:MAG: ABC transporter permease subunit [Lachnotalea sp.]